LDKIKSGNSNFFKDYNITPAEKTVIEHMLKGKSNKEIAKAIFRSIDTVADHFKNIRIKTNCNSKTEIILKIFRGE
jgi:DNA-binding CsgD family transcriptional regulator